MLVKNRSFWIIFDIAVVLLSFLIAVIARYSIISDRLTVEIWSSALLLMFLYIMVILFYQPSKSLMKRSYWNEGRTVFTINLYMALLLTMVLYLLRIGTLFPRSFYIVFFVTNCILMYIERCVLKSVILSYYRNPENQTKLMVCTNWGNVTDTIVQYLRTPMLEYEIVAIAEIGDSDNGKITIHKLDYRADGTYIVTDTVDFSDFIRHQVIDEALLVLPKSEKEEVNDLVSRLEVMGIVTHVAIDIHEQLNAVMGDFGSYHVLTYSPRIFEPTELFLKRVMDIISGMIGSCLMVVLSIFIIPAIKLESPGPAIFSQTRVGRNGRRFSIYKFRSMYMDAEQKQKDLMKYNEMNGYMFKVKNDPRITKVGKFLRKTSLDEFPQFFNVLRGDMSLVGTRPPTESEFLKYEEHHKRRLSLKPGITGMWQVSGRSDIRDFEEVVSLDLKYIDNWSVWLDMRLMLQTIIVVLFRKGAS